MIGTWQQILATYRPEKRRWDRIYPWIGYVLRPISFVLTAPLVRLGVTANQVTAFSGILGLVGCGLLARGTPQGFLWGGVCVTLLNLFDCVDGNLARLRPTDGPQVGKFYDQLVGYLFPLVYFFLGLGLGRVHPTWAVALAAAGGATALFRLLVVQVRGEFQGVLGSAWQEARALGLIPHRSHAYRWYARCYYNVTDLQGHDFLIWALAPFGTLPLFLAASLFVATVDFLFTLVFHLRRASGLRGAPRLPRVRRP